MNISQPEEGHTWSKYWFVRGKMESPVRGIQVDSVEEYLWRLIRQSREHAHPVRKKAGNSVLCQDKGSADRVKATVTSGCICKQVSKRLLLVKGLKAKNSRMWPKHAHTSPPPNHKKLKILLICCSIPCGVVGLVHAVVWETPKKVIGAPQNLDHYY